MGKESVKYVATAAGKRFSARKLHRVSDLTLFFPILTMSKIVRWVARYPAGKTYEQIKIAGGGYDPPPRVRKSEMQAEILSSFRKALKKGYLRKI